MDESLGVLVISQDAEETISACLESVRFADQRLVVDSGSGDATVELARSSGATVRHQPWLGYSRQKQFALELLETEWALWIDADEEVSPPLAQEIRDLLGSEVEAAGVTVPRLTRYQGRWIRHGGWYPDRKLRLFRRTRGRFDDRLVHESVEVEGPVGALRHPIFHYPYRDRRHHLQKIERYARLAAEQMRRDGRTAGRLDLWLRPVARFLKMFVIRGGFLDGRVGLTIAMMGARYVRRKYRYALETEGSRGADSTSGQ